MICEQNNTQSNYIYCPKCHNLQSKLNPTTYLFTQNEKGPHGNILSQTHQHHKNVFRFRCINSECKAIFCAGCQEIPYHIGYDCTEFQKYKLSPQCRFCQVLMKSDNRLETTTNPSLICNSTECVEKSKLICNVQFECGHFCIGMQEEPCFGCLNMKCLPKNAPLTDEDYCNICWVDPLLAAPTVKLKCGHYFHYLCLVQKIEGGFVEPRLTFGFLNCPLCKICMAGHSFWGYTCINENKNMTLMLPRIVQDMVEGCKLSKYIPNGIIMLIGAYLIIPNIIQKYVDLKHEVQMQAREIGYIYKLNNDRRLTDNNVYNSYYNNYDKFVFDRFNFHLCFKCINPYFGGYVGHREAGLYYEIIWKKDELICGSCANNTDYKCTKHGSKYLKYKCKFCCRVSAWFCWGSTHFCRQCHNKQINGDYLNRKPISELSQCPGKDQCPLGIEHPVNGVSEYFIGCILCKLMRY